MEISKSKYQAYILFAHELGDVSYAAPGFNGDFDTIEKAEAALYRWVDQIGFEVESGALPVGEYLGRVRDGIDVVTYKSWHVWKWTH